MRRPLVAITSIYIMGIISSYIYETKSEKVISYFTVSVCVFSLVFVVLVLLISKAKGSNIFKNYSECKKYLLPFFLILILGHVMFSFAYNNLEMKDDDSLNSVMEVKGKVISVDVKEYTNYRKTTLTLKIDEMNYKGVRGGDGESLASESSPENFGSEFKLISNFFSKKIHVVTYEEVDNPEKLIGSTIMVDGQLERPVGKRNPNCFNYNLYLKTEGVAAIMQVDNFDSITTIENAKGLDIVRNIIWVKKFNFSYFLDEHLGDRLAGIVMALLFGEKNGLSEEDLDKFQKNGVIHILAVSGLHVSIVYAFCIIVFGSVRRKGTCIIILFILILYATLADFTPSVSRAIVMICIHIFASVRFYRYDMLSATAFAGLVLLILNPIDLFSLGFQLSFGATFLLSIFIEFAKRRKKIGKLHNMLPIILLQLAMLPFTAYTFNYISFIGILANIPIVFLASLAVPIGMICFLITMFGIIADSWIEEILVILLEVVSKLFLFINDFFYIERISSIVVVSPPLFLIVLFYIMIIIIFGEWGVISRCRKQYKKIFAVVFICVISCNLFGNIFTDKYSDIKYVFVDIGQGDCIHIKTPSGKNIMVDGGGSFYFDVGRKTLMPYFLKNGVGKIDLAIVTHMDLDHVGGVVSLAEEGFIDKIAVYEGIDTQYDNYLTLKENAEIVYLKKGDRITIEESVYLDIINPIPELIEKNNENNNSIVSILNYGEDKVFLSGDIEGDLELKISEEFDVRSNVLKVSHHGSDSGTSEEFLNKVSPDIAVFQVGGNNYGHPSKRIVELCKKKGIIIYRNDADGAIRFYSNGEVLVTSDI